MRKLLLCVTLLLLTNAHAAGQAGDAEEAPRNPLPAFVRLGDAGAEARRLLQSGENRERAWGAYLAGLHGLTAETPRLVELLADPALDAGGWEEARVRRASLDALIQLGAEVPAETLLRLKQSAPDEVIILLARAPHQNQQALLSLFDDASPDSHWLAVGNLLAETRAVGFAARLMAGLKMAGDIYVYDYEGERGYGAGGCGGCGCGCNTFRSPDEYPPVFHYSLTRISVGGAVVAAPGRRTVYYVRSASPPCNCGEGGCGSAKDQYRVEYIAGLLGTTEEELKLEFRPSREVVCSDAGQCRRALAAVRDEIVGGYTQALNRLFDAGLLDAAEAAELKPDITLRLNDSRDRRPFPLPSKLKGVKVEVLEINAGPADDAAEPATEEPPPGGPR